MPETRPPLDSLDDYERYLTLTLDGWSAERRTAFSAAMADRWLHVYTAFAEQEEWGDPDTLSRSIDAAWAHVSGRPLSAGDRARHLGLLHEITPHMDDFDAPEALAAAVIVQEAVSSCVPDNVGVAVQAGLSGFEAIVPDWSLDPEPQRRLWQRGPVRKELEKQLALLDRLAGTPRLDPDAIRALRKELTGRGLAGELPRRTAPAAPALRTNQDIFQQYREIIELEQRTRRDWNLPDVDPVTIVMLWFTEWSSRYKRRHDLLSGGYGKLADQVGQQALVRRQQARDLAVTAIPAWDAETRDMIDMVLGNPLIGLDVHSVEAAHGYGPSVRRLWAEATAQGRSGKDAWDYVIAWARHRPAVWDEEDRRKRKGRGVSSPAVGAHLAREIEWSATGDPDHPWRAEVDGASWRVRLNDFPDEIMYTLLIGGEGVGDFHDWPETWRRE